jgi:hypothetical protein
MCDLFNGSAGLTNTISPSCIPVYRGGHRFLFKLWKVSSSFAGGGINKKED